MLQDKVAKKSDTEVLVYFNLLTFNVHGRAGQQVDTVTMVFALVVIYVERFGLLELSCGLCKERAELL